jgi:hypothetical protein
VIDQRGRSPDPIATWTGGYAGTLLLGRLRFPGNLTESRVHYHDPFPRVRFGGGARTRSPGSSSPISTRMSCRKRALAS